MSMLIYFDILILYTYVDIYIYYIDAHTDRKNKIPLK